jgi:PAS domain-containing protein
MNATQNTAEPLLLERLSVATQAAGLTCWEFSYVEERFTWFDREPPDMSRILPEDQQHVREETQRALDAGKESLSSVMRQRDTQGNLQYVRVYQRFFRDAEGKPLRALGSTRDVTAEVMAAEKLRLQAELLQEVQRRLDRASLSIHEGHWEIDVPTGRHWASKSYLALLGLPENSGECDTVPKARDRIHPDDREMIEIVSRRHYAGGAPYDAELRLRLADGSYRWFRVRGSAEFDSQGHSFRVSGSISDIHKQHLAEEALREAQARFTRAIHGTQDGLWEIDATAGRLWLSPRLSELLGFADGELGDRLGALRARAHPDFFASMENSARVAIEQGESGGVSLVSTARYAGQKRERGGAPDLRVHAGYDRNPPRPR